MSTLLVQGDAREIPLADRSVQCAVTSPPYWGLRDYKVVGQIGLEPTLGEYLAVMVGVFREVRRVLRDDGTCWVNMGNSFSGGNRGGGGSFSYERRGWRDVPCGISGKGSQGCSGDGLPSLHLCDECRASLSSRISHIGSRLVLESAACESDQTRERIPSPAPSLCSSDFSAPPLIVQSYPAKPDPVPQRDRGASPERASSQSTIDESWPPPQGECWHCANCGACLSVLRSSSRDARACARNSVCTGGTARHQRTLNANTSDTEPLALASLYSIINSLNFKAKDEVNQAHFLALALQADGWYLRSTIVWAKPNPMPESVTDRPTKSHEYIFLLSKSQRYYFDAEAVREGNVSSKQHEHNQRYAREYAAHTARAPGTGQPGNVNNVGIHSRPGPAGRNLRSVWTMTTRACKEAHFATFPIDLPLRCIKAGTSERGRCPHCGAPWRRVVEKIPTGQTQKMVDGWDAGAGGHGSIHRNGREAGEAEKPVFTTLTTHWLPTCKCPTPDPVPCVVLDPFGGAGTTAMAAKELGRHCVIVERKWEYLQIAAPRIARHQPRVRRARRNPGSASGAPGLFDEVPA